MLQRTSSTLTALVCAALLPSAAWAAGPPAMVAGTGEASVRLVPTKLRMQLQVDAHGKTAESAIQRLKARREAVADNLFALGAEKQSLNVGDPSVNKVTPSIGPSFPTPGPYFPSAPSYIPALPAPRTSPPGGYSPPMMPAKPVPVAPPAGYTFPPSGPVPSLPPGTTSAPSLTPLSPGSSPVELTPDAAPTPAATQPTIVPLPGASQPTPPSTPGPPSAPISPSAPVLPGTSVTPPHYTPASTSPYTSAPASPDTPALAPPTGAPTYGQYGAGPLAPTQPRAARLPASQPELYAATTTLTVEWSLKAETVEEAALAGEAIRKKILAADLMGGKAADKLPADEQELLDEQIGPHTTSQTISRPVVETFADGRNVVRIVQEQVVTAPGGPLSTAADVPSLLYVAAISGPQRKALLAEAFGNAKSQAAELAEASGGKLGAVSNLSGEVRNSKPGVRFMDVSPPTPPQIIRLPNENSSEATAAEPGGLKFQAKVHAMFLLE